MFLIPVTQLQSFASQKFCKLPFLSHPHPSFCTWRNHLFFFFFCLLFCTAKSMLKKWRVDLLHTSCNTIFNLWAWGPNILNHSKKKWILKSKCWAESLLLFLPKSEVIKWKSCNSNPHHWHFKIMHRLVCLHIDCYTVSMKHIAKMKSKYCTVLKSFDKYSSFRRKDINHMKMSKPTWTAPVLFVLLKPFYSLHCLLCLHTLKKQHLCKFERTPNLCLNPTHVFLPS